MVEEEIYCSFFFAKQLKIIIVTSWNWFPKLIKLIIKTNLCLRSNEVYSIKYQTFKSVS